MRPFPLPHDKCCLQVSEAVSWHKLRCCYSANILQHWVRGKSLVYFCKVDHSRIFQKFCQELTFSQKFMWDMQVALFPTTIYMLRSIYSFCKIKSDCIKNLSFTDYASRIWQHDFIVKCFEIDLFLSLHLMTGPSSMSISSLVIKLWKFIFKGHRPAIQKLEIPPSKFYPIFGDWVGLGIPTLAWMSLMKCY